MEGTEANPLEPTTTRHGKKTDRGKKLDPKGPSAWTGMRLNALKSGLFASDPVIPEIDGPDAPRQYKRLIKRLYRELKPTSTLEMMCVDELAQGLMLRGRVLRYLWAETVKLVEDERERAEGTETAQLRSLLGRADPRVCEQRAMKLQQLIEALDVVRKHIQESGHLSPEAQNLLIQNFPVDTYSWVHSCLLINLVITRQRESGAEGSALLKPEEGKEFLLRMVESERDRLSRRIPSVAARELRVRQSEIGRHALPPRETQEKILRSLMVTMGRIYKAWAKLEELQSWRGGALSSSARKILKHMDSKMSTKIGGDETG